MYSAVLMAALATAPTTQSWHRGHGCHGCHGSYGCYGTRCYAAANTCWYGCYGGNGYGGNGHGWHGYPSGCYYGWGVGHPGTFTCHGCYGCYGGWSCYGYPVHHTAAIESAPPSGGIEPKGPPSRPGQFEETPLPKELQKKKTEEQVRARVLIDVPADAKLYVDDILIPSSSARRVFQTPNLVPGQTYFYDVRAEVVRDGRTVSASQRLLIRPGQQAAASFADLGRPTDATALAGRR